MKQITTNYVIGFLENTGGFFFTSQGYPTYRICLNLSVRGKKRLIENVIRFIEARLKIKFHRYKDTKYKRAYWCLTTRNGLKKFVKFANANLYLKKGNQQKVMEYLEQRQEQKEDIAHLNGKQ